MEKQLTVTEVSLSFSLHPARGPLQNLSHESYPFNGDQGTGFEQRELDKGSKPKTPVDKVMPFVVDTRGKETERVVPVGADAKSLPDWILNCKRTPLPRAPPTGFMKFIYASELQNIECTFKESRSVITFSGIKYCNVAAFLDEHLSKVFGILEAEPSGEPVMTYRATMTLDVGISWDKNLIADVITNDPEISQVAAISETASTLCSRYLFSVSVSIPARGPLLEFHEELDKGPAFVRAPERTSQEYARVTLRQDDLDGKTAIVTMSRLPDVKASAYVAGVVNKIFDVYSRCPIVQSSNCTSLSPGVSYNAFSRLSGIRSLRSELPELFINNYTRECPVLPIMVSGTQAELLEDTQRVIYYPAFAPSPAEGVGGSMGVYPSPRALGRFYTAPKGYFVGLKRNRLANRDVFPCLVTCYLHDHMLRKGSETYNYYMGEDAAGRSRTKPSKPIPRNMEHNLSSIGKDLCPTLRLCPEPRRKGETRLLVWELEQRAKGPAKDSGYSRKRASSFMNAIEAATGKSVDTESLPWCPQVTKQETWGYSDADIMDTIRSGKCKPHTYRYFEELLCVSIHVIVIKDGTFDFFVPSCDYEVPRILHRVWTKGVGQRSSILSGRKSYIWKSPYPQHIVVFETVKKTYGETNFLYDFLVKDDSVAMFDSSDPVVSSVVSQKNDDFTCPIDISDAIEQLIDERGKCRMVKTYSGEQIMTLTRPLTVPVMPDPACFFDLHISKMNAIKGAMDLCKTDLYKRSTKDVLYFPNDSSFRYWVQAQQLE